MDGIPEAVINFAAFGEDNAQMLGIADVELPELEAMTVEVKGAGVAGVIDAPIQGHYTSTTLKLNWRTITGNVSILTAPKAHQLDIRASVQEVDPAEGANITKPIKLVVKAIPKKTGLGKFDVGEKSDTTMEFETVYLKLTVGDDVKIELDKFAYICVIEGVDYLESVRTDLGLGG